MATTTASMKQDSIFNKRKIAVMGSRSVGKSSLVMQFTENAFRDHYFPTIENTFSTAIRHPRTGQTFQCDIIDTAGQDEYSLISQRLSIGIDGYVLVYSVTSRASFELVRTVHDKLRMAVGLSKVPCVVVGQKVDLGDTNHRQVEQAEGKQLAKELGSAWCEASARNNINVEQVFTMAIGEIEKSPDGGADGEGEEKKGGCAIM